MFMRDEEIQRNVLEQFKWHARIKPTEIGVTVNDGVVTLVGTVDSYTKKWNAEDAALRVKGVKAVANELEVKLPLSLVRNDEDIARAAMLALESSVDIPDTIKVAVEKGWVTLRGQIEWYYQKMEAEHKVRDIIGVKGVSNQIEVSPSVKPKDLKRRIEEALLRTVQSDARNIHVDVQDGKVILKGKVHSWFEKEEAKHEAWRAPGVREVVDELAIAP